MFFLILHISDQGTYIQTQLMRRGQTVLSVLDRWWQWRLYGLQFWFWLREVEGLWLCSLAACCGTFASKLGRFCLRGLSRKVSLIMQLLQKLLQLWLEAD